MNSPLQAGLTESAPMTVEQFEALDPSTKALIIAGAYDSTWKDAKSAWIDTAGRDYYRETMYLYWTGSPLQYH